MGESQGRLFMKKNCRSVDDRPLPCSVLEVNSYNGEYQLFNILCTDCTALIRDAKAIDHLVDSHWYWNHIMGSGIKIERFHIPTMIIITSKTIDMRLRKTQTILTDGRDKSIDIKVDVSFVEIGDVKVGENGLGRRMLTKFTQRLKLNMNRKVRKSFFSRESLANIISTT